MGSVFSTTEASVHACRLQTGGRSEQGELDGCHQRLQQLLSQSTTDLLHFQFKMAEELGNRVHRAINQKDMSLLGFLVDSYKAPLEERNEQGMTPLYHAVHCNWPNGALYLLKRGADVLNAESALQNVSPSQAPLLHLALKTRSPPLLTKLIKQGASIRVRDAEGEYCVNVPLISPDVLFQCMADAVTISSSRRADLLKDLFFVISTGTKFQVHHRQVRKFIKKQHTCHQKKMFQVFAACLCGQGACNDKLVLHYWRKSADCTPCHLHDHPEDEENAPRSVLADILNVKNHPLPDTVTTPDQKLATCCHAVLAIEKHMPDDDFLFKASERLLSMLFDDGKVVTTIRILSRLTNVRPLYEPDVYLVMQLLSKAVKDLRGIPEISLVVLLDSMKTIESCLSDMKARCSEVQLPLPLTKKNALETALKELFIVFLLTISTYYGERIRETPHQLQSFTCHIKDFLRSFPCNFCPFAFHLLAWNVPGYPRTASMIKMLVASSAEVRGRVRQENFPPHLLSDWNGDTPLHRLALIRSQQDLVQEGVLQCFLDHGAHLCIKNNQGETVRSILVERGVCTEGELLPALQCLAAAAFMKEGRLRRSVQNCRPAAVRNFLLDH